MRYLMLPMLLVMWGGIYWMWTNGHLTLPLIVGVATTHIICAVIFYNFISAFNFGYAALMALVPVIYAAAAAPALTANIFLAMPVLYGLRLAFFTWRRNRSDSYAERRRLVTAGTSTLPLPVTIIIWLFLSSLMFFVTFNAWIVASSGRINPTIWFALFVMVVGLGIEAIADQQKQDVKRIDKNAGCYIGLYRRIRHPNYLGEIVFHMGLYWGMIAATDKIYALVLAGLGTGWVVAMMCTEAVNLDRRQQQFHAGSVGFEEYRKNSGLLLPKIF